MGIEIRVNAIGLDIRSSPRSHSFQWALGRDVGRLRSEGRGVYQQVYNGDGTPVFTNSSAQPMERRVNMTAPEGSEAQRSSVEAFRDGWIVTWTQRVAGSGEDIFVQRFDKDGVPQLRVNGQLADIRVNQTITEEQEAAQVTILPDGWLVTWVDTFRHGVFQQRFDANGQALYQEGGACESIGVSRQ